MRTSWKLAIAIVLSPLTLLAQHSQKASVDYLAAPIGAQSGSHASMPMMGSMPTVVPIFFEDGETSSSLVIVNESAVNAGATVSVHDLSGKELNRVHRALVPHEQQEIPLQTLLSGMANPVHVGSITVTQDANLKGMIVVGQLLITNTRGSLPSYIDEELAMPSPSGSSTLRGVGDEALGDALLAVTNTSSSTQRVTLHCLSEKAELQPAVITISAMATSLISGCTGQTVTDLDSYLENVNERKQGQERVHGYELVASGGAGSFAVFGLAPHFRNNEIVLSSIPFTDPGLLRSPNTAFAGVPFGPQSALPDGVYTPQISFSNFATSPAHVNVYLAATEPPEPASLSGAGASPEKMLLRQLTIAPRSTVGLELRDASLSSGLLQSLMVETDRKPGEVQSKVVSRSDGSLFEVEMLGKDEKDESDGGIHPWSVEGDYESHLLLFNHSDKPLNFDVGISNGVILWDKKYTIAPYETRDISFNELIQDKVKDRKGQVLSPERNHGVVNWMVPDLGEATGRLMVVSRSQVSARSFSCAQFIVVCGFIVETGYGGYLPIDTYLPLYTGDPSFCAEYSPSQCEGGTQVGSGGANFNWSVGAASVVRFNTPSDQYSESPNIYGVGAGSGYAYGSASAAECTMNGNGSPPQVQVPNNIVVAKDVTKTFSCGTPFTAKERMITYTIYSGSTPMSGPVPIYENVPPTTSTCSGKPVQTGSTCTPNDDYEPGTPNQFNDVLLACPEATVPNPCGFTFANQQWQYCKSDGTKASIGTVGKVTVLNTQVTVDGNSTSLPTGTTFH